jgi:hypothetical protein
MNQLTRIDVVSGKKHKPHQTLEQIVLKYNYTIFQITRPLSINYCYASRPAASLEVG